MEEVKEIISETGVYHVSLAFQFIYGCCNERGENGNEKKGESRHCLTFCMQVTWVCVASWRKV